MLRCKPCGRGFRLVTTLRIDGGHMERALTVVVGSVFDFGGIRWRILEIHA
jgi:hypothetical protein